MGKALRLCLAALALLAVASPAGGEVRKLRLLPERIPPPVKILPPDGIPCTRDNQCATGNCIEGFCCDTRCEGNCRSCALPGRRGTCTPVPDGQDPKRVCMSVVGGHPLCIAKCFSGQCAFPDVGTSCEICAACDGRGRCTSTPPDDARCGVVDCSGLDTGCRRYDDLVNSRCAALGVCKHANHPATCAWWKDSYSWVDQADVRRECATGRILNCYKYGTRLLWKDGAVIRDCRSGQVCNGCPGPPPAPKPEDWEPKSSRYPR
jgi:hypothetical protein